MSLQISALPSSPPAKKTSNVDKRKSANFHPGIWGDYFLKYASDSNSMSYHAKADDQIERLKGEVRKKITTAIDEPSQKLSLIDQVQRLGIAYHFEIEINQQLEQIHQSYNKFHYDNNNQDLHTSALLFRLLRQEGYPISCEIFNKFKDSKGNFRESLVADMQGLLSLFEACHLRFHGEDILSDALTFTMTHLESIDKEKANPNLQKQISHALNLPIHKGTPRLKARHYIPLYQEEPLHDEVLLSLAKLDFNLLQEQHQKELGNLTRWWNDLNVERKFPFARDRLVEMYLWMSGVYFEPEYEVAREILTKMAIIVSIIDDIYDVYGTLEELHLFTKAIERWDVNAKDGLPEYMQACYQTVLDLYDQIDFEVTRKGQSHRLFYVIEAMKSQVRAFFTEAKWYHQNHVPTMEEYIPIASASSALELLLVTSLLAMGDIVTKDTFEWLLYDNPKIVKAVQVLSRLINDIAAHKFEQERGHVASAVECFMNQYGVSEEEAKKELEKQVAEAWEDINEELCRLNVIPRPILARFLNMTRCMHVMYNDEVDIYTHAKTTMKERVTSLYINPLPV